MLLCFLFALIVAGCATTKKGALQSNKELLRRAHAEVWSQGNLAAADELYAPDFVCHFVAGSEWKGVEGLRAEVRRHRASFPDWHEHIEQIVAEGDFVVTRFTSTGTQLGPFNGRPATGREVKISELSVHRIANGKIAEQWGIPDVVSLDQQPGIRNPGAENKRSAADTKNATRANFIGAWRLVSFESKADWQTTHPFGREAQGTLVYSPGGRISVVLSKPDRGRFAGNDAVRATPEEKVAAFDSFLSYFGTFDVNGNVVIHRIEQCSFPNWIGTEQRRFFLFDGNRLTLETPPIQTDGQPTVSRLTWERVTL
jgi:steroid delta-isomerase-like uncharacterized protein